VPSMAAANSAGRSAEGPPSLLLDRFFGSAADELALPSARAGAWRPTAPSLHGRRCGVFCVSVGARAVSAGAAVASAASADAALGGTLGKLGMLSRALAIIMPLLGLPVLCPPSLLPVQWGLRRLALVRLARACCELVRSRSGRGDPCVTCCQSFGFAARLPARACCALKGRRGGSGNWRRAAPRIPARSNRVREESLSCMIVAQT
jgi:hypothetical protein